MDTDSFVSCTNTNDITKGKQTLKKLFDFNNLNNNHALFSNENKKK